MHHIDKFYGRHLSEWLEIDAIMRCHNIETPSKLSDVLGMKAASRRNVRVVDHGNEKRILGHITLDTLDLTKGEYIQMALMSHISPREYSADFASPTEIRRATFTIRRETFDGGWTYTPYLATATSLDSLMTLDRFRLPGETERDAMDRLRRR